MRGLWAGLLLVGALWATRPCPAESQEAPVAASSGPEASDQAFYQFLTHEQMVKRPTTVKEFRQQVQDACGDFPLRPSGPHGGDSVQGVNGAGGICAVLVLACGACGKDKPAFIVSGVEGIVVGQMDMAATDRMLTRGFGRLFRVMGELCGDYRFATFAESFVKPPNKVGDDAYVVGVFGVKEFGSEMRPSRAKAGPTKSVVPARYFDPYEYRTRCKKTG